MEDFVRLFWMEFLESPGNPHDGIDNDGDGMIDESQFDGVDNDGDWDPERDDIGADGLADFHIITQGQMRMEQREWSS